MLHDNAQRESHGRGFTLVELLVVVAIIALLISILLPAMNSARTVARTVIGLSNQRQIMASIMMYAQDYEGHLPMGQSSAGNCEWVTTVNGYLTGRGYTWGATGKISPMFKDANATLKGSYSHYSGHPKLLTMVTPPDYTTPKIGSVVRPMDIMTIVDGTQQGSGPSIGFVQQRAWSVDGIFQAYSSANAEKTISPGPNVDIGSYPSAHIRFRQRNDTAANMGFFDAHAATVDMGEVKQKHVRLE